MVRAAQHGDHLARGTTHGTQTPTQATANPPTIKPRARHTARSSRRPDHRGCPINKAAWSFRKQPGHFAIRAVHLKRRRLELLFLRQDLAVAVHRGFQPITRDLRLFVICADADVRAHGTLCCPHPGSNLFLLFHAPIIPHRKYAIHRVPLRWQSRRSPLAHSSFATPAGTRPNSPDDLSSTDGPRSPVASKHRRQGISA